MKWFRQFDNRRVRVLVIDESGTRAMLGVLEVMGAGYIRVGGRPVKTWSILKCDAL
jgi:hypothetical protein